MNRYQKRYATAKAAADQARYECSKQMEAHADLLNSDDYDDIERYCELEANVREMYDVRTIENMEHEAEEALLDWCYSAMMKLHPEHKETFALTLAPGSKARKWLNHRADMIDTAFRLAA